MNTQMNLRRISVEKLKPAKYNPRKDLRPGDPVARERVAVVLMRAFEMGIMK